MGPLFLQTDHKSGKKGPGTDFPDDQEQPDSTHSPHPPAIIDQAAPDVIRYTNISLRRGDEEDSRRKSGRCRDPRWLRSGAAPAIEAHLGAGG